MKWYLREVAFFFSWTILTLVLTFLKQAVHPFVMSVNQRPWALSLSGRLLAVFPELFCCGESHKTASHVSPAFYLNVLLILGLAWTQKRLNVEKNAADKKRRHPSQLKIHDPRSPSLLLPGRKEKNQTSDLGLSGSLWRCVFGERSGETENEFESATSHFGSRYALELLKEDFFLGPAQKTRTDTAK